MIRVSLAALWSCPKSASNPDEMGFEGRMLILLWSWGFKTHPIRVLESHSGWRQMKTWGWGPHECLIRPHYILILYISYMYILSYTIYHCHVDIYIITLHSLPKLHPRLLGLDRTYNLENHITIFFRVLSILWHIFHDHSIVFCLIN